MTIEIFIFYKVNIMCDTFVSLSSATRDGSIIFGKNSDREPNEAQVLEFYPAIVYSNGDDVIPMVFLF